MSSFDISVILPVFWREYSHKDVLDLGTAIDSVMNQDYPEALELLVIDDGSACPIADTLVGTTYSTDVRIRFIRLPRNNGLVNALNVGLMLAKHELIGRIDSDDYWLPGKIAKQLALLENDPDLTIIGTGMRQVFQNGQPEIEHIRPGGWGDILHFFATVGCPFPHGSILARRTIYHLLGGYSHDPHFSHCEDFALWGVWVRFFKPSILQEVLYNYTVSSTSVSSMHTEAQRLASRRVHQIFRDLGETGQFPVALQGLSEILHCSLFDAGRLAFLIWKYRAATNVPEEAVEYLRVLLPDRSVIAKSRTEPPGIAPSRCIQAPGTQCYDSQTLVRVEVT